jgi:hypothetical protein
MRTTDPPHLLAVAAVRGPSSGRGWRHASWGRRRLAVRSSSRIPLRFRFRLGLEQGGLRNGDATVSLPRAPRALRPHRTGRRPRALAAAS